ncbi:MAG: hypothetical protein ABIF10_03155, partial [Candidatus Woesearchaeota archaeon]
VMLASGIMRLFATLIFIPRIREVRPVQHIPYWKLFFRVATVAPTEGLLHEFSNFRTNLVTITNGISDFNKKVIVRGIKKIPERVDAGSKAIVKGIKKIPDKIDTGSRLIVKGIKKMPGKKEELDKAIKKEYRKD